jgi:regulator of protease activity HflC (stomatin/prohibitin superfamily)
MPVTAPLAPAKRLRGWHERHQLKIIIGLFVFVFGVIALWPFVVVYIDSGHAGVYYSLFFGGTDTRRVRHEGIQFKLPWDKIFDYDVRLQQLVYTYTVISADGLIIQFKTSVRCRPRLDNLGKLQRIVGPDYADKIVIPETQAALREVVGDTPIDQIYSTNITVLQKAILRSVEQVSGKFIEIDDILITGIDIPETIKQAIEAKITQQQNALQYDYVLRVAKKEAERKRMEAEGIRDFQNIVTPGISENFLRWKGIEATLDLAKSNNSKVVVIGAQNGLPLILDTSSTIPTTSPSPGASPKPSVSPFQEPAVPKMQSSGATHPDHYVPVPVATPLSSPLQSSAPIELPGL